VLGRGGADLPDDFAAPTHHWSFYRRGAHGAPSILTAL
jgi:hypothetical protein